MLKLNVGFVLIAVLKQDGGSGLLEPLVLQKEKCFCITRWLFIEVNLNGNSIFEQSGWLVCCMMSDYSCMQGFLFHIFEMYLIL